MRSFFKQVLAVIVGMTLFQIIFFVLLFIFLTVMVASLSKQVESQFADGFGQREEVEVEPNSLLRLELDYPIPERSIMQGLQWKGGSFEIEEPAGLYQIERALEKAASDENIKGVYLRLGVNPNSYAVLDVVREALIDFKEESGKFVMAYGEVVSQKSYFLASVADAVYLHPEGTLVLPGTGAKLTFFGDALDRLGVDMQIFRKGKFKSAVEPFTETEASEANEQQYREFLMDYHNMLLQAIGESRGLDNNTLNQVMDSLLAAQPSVAMKRGLVDDLFYADEMEATLREQLGLDADADIEWMPLNKYVKSVEPADGDETIAVLFAQGSIVMDGEGQDMIAAREIIKTIRELRDDNDVKGVVLRINSPGGSALASDMIWRELKLLAEEKPVVSSFGSVAASGGYYIASGTDYIFSERNTLTGSIGVFGLIPNMNTFFNEKLGITFDEINLNEHATADGVTNAFDDYEMKVIQKGVDSVYQTFKLRVAEGRDMDTAAVHAVAQGRVWTGSQALEHNLVDELGGLDEAIAYVATQVDLSSYSVSLMPKVPNPFEELFGDFYGTTRSKVLERELGEYAEMVKQLEQLKEMEGEVQARLPYAIELH